MSTCVRPRPARPAVCPDPAPKRSIVAAKPGPAGMGAPPQAGPHPPTGVGTLKAYKVFSPQHEKETPAAGAGLAPGGLPPPLAFVPQSTPAVRGIYACSYLVYDDARPDGLREWYQKFYDGSHFIRVMEETSKVTYRLGTNQA